MLGVAESEGGPAAEGGGADSRSAQQATATGSCRAGTTPAFNSTCRKYYAQASQCMPMIEYAEDCTETATCWLGCAGERGDARQNCHPDSEQGRRHPHESRTVQPPRPARVKYIALKQQQCLCQHMAGYILKHCQLLCNGRADS